MLAEVEILSPGCRHKHAFSLDQTIRTSRGALEEELAPEPAPAPTPGSKTACAQQYFTCEHISPMRCILGDLAIDAGNLAFRRHSSGDTANGDAVDAHTEFHHDSCMERWRLSELRSVHRRRYLLRWTALEFLFADRSSVLFNFPMVGTDEAMLAVLGNVCPAALATSCVSECEVDERLAMLRSAWQGASVALVISGLDLVHSWQPHY